MAFNWTLAKAMNHKIVTPQKPSGGLPNKADVRVSRLKSKSAYRISFSRQAAMKINEDQIVLDLDGFRVFIIPKSQYQKCEKGYAFRAPKEDSKGSRPFFEVQKSVVGDLDRFVGDHDLKYSEDFDGYYITPNSSKEAIA